MAVITLHTIRRLAAGYWLAIAGLMLAGCRHTSARLAAGRLRRVTIRCRCRPGWVDTLATSAGVLIANCVGLMLPLRSHIAGARPLRHWPIGAADTYAAVTLATLVGAADCC